MGKRILLLKQDAIGHIFAPRGLNEALVISLCGPNIPEGTKAAGMLLFPRQSAVGIVLEHESWSDFVTPGTPEAGGIQLLPDPSDHFHTMVVPITMTLQADQPQVQG
jgi:hypothetical protein